MTIIQLLQIIAGLIAAWFIISLLLSIITICFGMALNDAGYRAAQHATQIRAEEKARQKIAHIEVIEDIYDFSKEQAR